MNFYEADILKIQRKIKELEANPGRRLKSYKIYWEEKIKERREESEAWRLGKPISDINHPAERFCRAMGIVCNNRDQIAGQRDGGLSGAMSPIAYKEKARALGLPVDNACDMNYLIAGMVEAGDAPPESYINCTNFNCPVMTSLKFFMVSRWPNDIFYWDIPFFETEAALEYVVDQEREFIKFAEKKFPGVLKYDEDKLIEFQARDRAAASLNYEMYAMQKHEPCPVTGHDVVIPGDWQSLNLEFLRARRDEIAERVEKGFAGLPGAKLRVVWEGKNLEWMDAYKVLEKWGIEVVFWFGNNITVTYRAPVSRPAYYGGRELTPMEEEAAYMLQHMRGGTAAHWIDQLINVCRDLKADAIISLQQLGGACTLGFKRLQAERAERELGIPTLQLEGKSWDPSYVDEAKITAKLDEFAQMCLARKGLA